MNKCQLFVGLIFALFGAFDVSAYEVSTHQILTRQAAVRSVLNPANGVPLLSDLGFGNWGDESYIPSTGGDRRTLLDIMDFGAVYEDTHYALRVFNHFFDPQYNNFTGRPLHISYDRGNTSPDWAIEDRGEVRHLAGIQSQEFSFRSGQQYLFNALTEPLPEKRRVMSSLAFQSLGQIVHHIQDMAQPQHVRNDQHVHDVGSAHLLAETEWSYFERYTENTINATIPAILNANSYLIPSFSTARQFWHTAGTNVPRYVGMAEFTAQNYVSFGTEFESARVNGGEVIVNNANFPLPSGVDKKIMPLRIDDLRFTDGVLRPGTFEFLIGNVYDENTKQTKTNQRLAAASLLTPHFNAKGLTARFFTENTEVYKDAYNVLLPRAVAFSAGLINHFFRGRIDFRKNTQANNKWYIDNLGTQVMIGQLIIYFENSAGYREPVPNAPVIYVNIAAGQRNYEITFPEPPSNARKLIAVFRGQIGSEGSPSPTSTGFYAVAGKVIGYTPPALPCGQLVTSGGHAGYDQPMELGSTAGKVSVQFQAYSIPDKLEIFALDDAGNSSVRLLSTGGQVTQYWEKTFQHDPAVRGSSKVRIKVTGNESSNTLWQLGVSCPGQPAPQVDRLESRYPTIVINQPLNGAVVSGDVTVSATADAHYIEGMQDVQFILDGQLYGSSIISPPYAMTLETNSLTNGSHTLAAKATNVAGNSATSTNVVFTVNNQATALGVANLISPSGTIASTVPSYTWNAVSGATSYRLYVQDSFGWESNTVYSAASLGCGAGTGICSIAPGIALVNGRSYNWYVLASNSANSGTWSSVTSFTVMVSENANLSNLALSSGSLSPVFASGTTSYTVSVPNSVSSITIVSTVADPTAVVAVNGVPTVSGSPSAAIALSVGSNPTITVLVTAGATTQAYTINVVREALDLIPLMMLLWED